MVLPLSWYERAGNAFFKSLTVADADGRLLDVYRKSHIPNAIGYQEKEYFSPGDTGFKVWDTAFGRLGIGICWDQWFPETARCLALMGAEVLLFPTAIGSEPGAAQLDSRDHWQIAMRGHAAANLRTTSAKARPLVEARLRDNPDIYLADATYTRLIPGKDIPQADMRARMRVWTRFKTAQDCPPCLLAVPSSST